MPEPSLQHSSVGQELLHQYGLRQGTVFPASLLDIDIRQAWADYRSEPKLRDKAIKESALLVVVSQDCDIACRDDNVDPCIELAIFSKIKPKQCYEGNQFAHSSRKLQLRVRDQDYEARARETIRVPKVALHDQLAPHQDRLFTLPPEQCRTFVLWRANRYQRAAMPDRFNETFVPMLQNALPEIERAAIDPEDSRRSYIRSLYVYLDDMGESKAYEFSLLALLRGDTPDETQNQVDDLLEDLCQQLETEPGFTLCNSQELAELAERETTVSVATLGKYVKLNLDYVSLSHGDPDTGV